MSKYPQSTQEAIEKKRELWARVRKEGATIEELDKVAKEVRSLVLIAREEGREADAQQYLDVGDLIVTIKNYREIFASFSK